jgi:hypothetical protein
VFPRIPFGGRAFYLAPDGKDLTANYRTIAVEIPCPAESFWGRR